MRVAVVQGAAVVRSNDEKARGLSVITRQNVSDSEKITQAFGHFLVVARHKAVVHPDAGQWFAGSTLALGNFILVMRKLQISATAMNVNGLTQHLAAHGRALDVPARATLAVNTRPFRIQRLVRFGRFPEHEIKRIILAVRYRHPFTGAQLIE